MWQGSAPLARKHDFAGYVYLWRVLRHPTQASREIAAWNTLRPGLLVVLSLGVYLTITCYLSALAGDYPPPADEMQVWMDTWGAFAMLPVVKVAPEQYRLFMSIIALPGTFCAWMLMAATGRLLARAYHRATGFDQYLNLFAFSFFPFWFLGVLGDGLYSNLLGSRIVPALRGAYGPLALAFVANYPPLLYTLLFGLGAVYNGLVARGAGGLRWWQAALTGWLTFLPPMLLVSLLYR